jgi:hypothetical protein
MVCHVRILVRAIIVCYARISACAIIMDCDTCCFARYGCMAAHVRALASSVPVCEHEYMSPNMHTVSTCRAYMRMYEHRMRVHTHIHIHMHLFLAVLIQVITAFRGRKLFKPFTLGLICVCECRWLVCIHSESWCVCMAPCIYGVRLYVCMASMVSIRNSDTVIIA